VLDGKVSAEGKLIAACLKSEGSLLVLPSPFPFCFPLLPFGRPLPFIMTGSRRILRDSCGIIEP
jgi:hypothetical protein